MKKIGFIIVGVVLCLVLYSNPGLPSVTVGDTMAVVGTQAVITTVPVRVIIPFGTAGGVTGIIPVVIGGAGQPPRVRVILPGIRCIATNPRLDGRDSESKIELFYY